ncbi:hypothetical protein SynBIOSU31_02807 [Synechococcus sp. BIOS-U3-1]|nr:hypothetical protein SynBIOSU31_02807 [Synechococcus sp. BIOS-U3-1]
MKLQAVIQSMVNLNWIDLVRHRYELHHQRDPRDQKFGFIGLILP